MNDGTWEAWLRKNGAERMDAMRDDIFDSKRRAFHVARYQRAASLWAGDRVLDYGCGTGYGTRILFDAMPQAVGYDKDAQAIEYAKQTHPGPKYVTCLCQVKGPFDMITCFECLEHLESPEDALRQMFSLLRPGGRICLSVPNGWPVADFHLHAYNAARILEELKMVGFGLETIEAQNSGSDWQYNHGKRAGFSDDLDNAECLFVCARRAPESVISIGNPEAEKVFVQPYVYRNRCDEDKIDGEITNG